MVRYSLNFVGWELRKAVAADLRPIYTAATLVEAEMRLTELDVKWGVDYFKGLAKIIDQAKPIPLSCSSRFLLPLG